MTTIVRKVQNKRQAPAAAIALLAAIQRSLDDDQAIDVAVIDMMGKSAIADFMVVASGRSQRHVAAMAENLRERVKGSAGRNPPVEGLAQADWVLVDAGDVIVHLFRPEVRAFYNLEKMWSQALPEQDDGMAGLVKEKIVKKRKKSTKAKVGSKKATKVTGGKTKVTGGKKPAGKAAPRRKPATGDRTGGRTGTRRRAAS